MNTTRGWPSKEFGQKKTNKRDWSSQKRPAKQTATKKVGNTCRGIRKNFCHFVFTPVKFSLVMWVATFCFLVMCVDLFWLFCIHLCIFVYIHTCDSAWHPHRGTFWELASKNPAFAQFLYLGAALCLATLGKWKARKRAKQDNVMCVGGGSANHIIPVTFLCREKPRTLSSWYFWFRCSWAAPSS